MQFERHGKWTNEKDTFWLWSIKTIQPAAAKPFIQSIHTNCHCFYILVPYHDDSHRRPKACRVSRDGFILLASGAKSAFWHVHCSFFIFFSPARRTFSSNAATTATPNFIKARSSYSFQRAWLSDPSTYPLLVAMAGATAICSGFMVYRLSTDKDIRISDKHKKAQLRP